MQSTATTTNAANMSNEDPKPVSYNNTVHVETRLRSNSSSPFRATLISPTPKTATLPRLESPTRLSMRQSADNTFVFEPKRVGPTAPIKHDQTRSLSTGWLPPKGKQQHRFSDNESDGSSMDGGMSASKLNLIQRRAGTPKSLKYPDVDYWVTTSAHHRKKYKKKKKNKSHAAHYEHSGSGYEHPSSAIIQRHQENEDYRRRNHHWAVVNRKPSKLMEAIEGRWIEPNGDDVVQEDSSPSPDQKGSQIYFKFRKVTDRDIFTDVDMLIELQAHGRGWLARNRADLLAKQSDAIMVIQSNLRFVLDPWMRLFWGLRPLINVNRAEEELQYLKSEIERYKALLKMLRYENTDYESRVTQLVQLIDQMSSNGMDNVSVRLLVDQMNSEAAHRHEYWDEMACSNRSLQLGSLTKVPKSLLNVPSPQLQQASPTTKLRIDADFYRDQMELVKEEANENEFRNGQHFQSQVEALQRRIEQLQSDLSTEGSRAARLDRRVEQLQTLSEDNESYQRNLEQLIGQMGHQLNQTVKVSAAPPLSSQVNGGDLQEMSTTIQHEQSEASDKVKSELLAYRELVDQLRTHMVDHPKAMASLAETPFKPGGEHDLFAPVTPIPMNSQAKGFFEDEPSTPFESNRLTKAEQAVEELKDKLAEAGKELKDKEDQLHTEYEDREKFELKSLELTDQVAKLQRKIERLQDEHDESSRSREMGHERRQASLNDQLDDEKQAVERLTKTNQSLEKQLADLKITLLHVDDEPDEGTTKLEAKVAKHRIELADYQYKFEEIQQDFDDYRLQHNDDHFNKMVGEKNELIGALEKEKYQSRMDAELIQVKLQSTTKLLDDTEAQLKLVSRERSQQAARLQQLETERDETSRNAAVASGRWSADREHLAAKSAELEQVRNERNATRRELVELTKQLAGVSAEGATDRKHLETRLKELETHNSQRILDLKEELEHYRGEVEHLQHQLQSVQADEAKLSVQNAEQKRKITELEEKTQGLKTKLIHNERNTQDLHAELGTVRTELFSSREMLTAYRGRNSNLQGAFQSLHDISDDRFSDRNPDSRSSSSSRVNGAESTKRPNRTPRSDSQQSNLDLSTS